MNGTKILICLITTSRLHNFIIFNSIIEKLNPTTTMILDDINSNVIDKSSDFIDTISRYIQSIDTFNKDACKI